MKRKWYRPVLYTICAYIVHPLFLVLPRAVVLQLAKFFGTCAFYLVKKERNKALSNLAYAFGDSEDEQSRKRLVKRIFVKLTGKWTMLYIVPTLFHFLLLIAIILSTNFLLIYYIFRLFKKLTKERGLIAH